VSTLRRQVFASVLFYLTWPTLHLPPSPCQVDVVVASVQTLGRQGAGDRLERFRSFVGLVVVDEAHHLTCDSTYDRVLRSWGLGGRKPGRRQPMRTPPVPGVGGQGPSQASPVLVGFTATPYRSLEADRVTEPLVYGPSCGALLSRQA
jgi:hypothetical protein